jgi:hypothetical protein
MCNSLLLNNSVGISSAVTISTPVSLFMLSFFLPRHGHEI